MTVYRDNFPHNPFHNGAVGAWALDTTAGFSPPAILERAPPCRLRRRIAFPLLIVSNTALSLPLSALHCFVGSVHMQSLR